MQTTQRLVDAKLMPKDKINGLYNKDAVDVLCKQHRDWLMSRAQSMVDTTMDTVDTLCMQTTQKLDDTKGHNEWLIQQRHCG